MAKNFNNKKGFGIVEVLIAAAVLGFMYMAVLNLQKGNREALLRIRGRDGAVEVAQQVLDSLKTVGLAAIPSCTAKDTSFDVPVILRSWDRGLGGTSTIAYSSKVTVAPTNDYVTSNESQYEKVSHVYAKQVNVAVSWNFKGSLQSINVSTVIR
ncbi:MAG: type II secretion system GspH family protein [Fibrobacter sp.]|nr:type II secretion system GspH family protein [Fibrobacter sp.]